MINLLPPKEKHELLFQKNMNLLVVLGSVTVVFLICILLVLLSLKFYILQKISLEGFIRKEAEAEYKTEYFLSILDSVKKHNTYISKAENFYKKDVYISNTLKSIIEIARPSGVVFGNIGIEKLKTDGKFKVSIKGTSLTRDALIAFKGNIESRENIKNVALPADDLIKPANINFDITFEIQAVNE